MKFKYLPHTADIKFQAFGKTLDQAFENAALATFQAMYENKIKEKIKKTIKVKGIDKESLLYNFLEELIFLLDTEGFFLSSIKVKITNLTLTATIKGDKAENYSIGLDVKAITYNEMFIKKQKDQFILQVVLDV